MVSVRVHGEAARQDFFNRPPAAAQCTPSDTGEEPADAPLRQKQRGDRALPVAKGRYPAQAAVTKGVTVLEHVHPFDHQVRKLR